MNDRVTKNYFKDGGDTLVIGGKLVVEEDAEVEGLDAGGGSLTPATASELGGVKVGNGLSAASDGTLSVAPASTTTVGGMKKMPYMADFTDSNFTGFEGHFNQLLAAMRAAGFMEDSE